MTHSNSGFGRVSETRLKSAVDPHLLREALRDFVPAHLVKGDLVVALAGEITSAGTLSDVVAWLAQSGRSGTLIVTTSEGTRALALVGGELASAFTTVSHERIGELLYRAASVSPEDLDEASVMGAIDGRPLGEVLVESGRLDVDTRDRLLARRAEEIFYAAMRATEGVFCVVDAPCDLPAIPGARPSLLSLLMESARRTDEMAVFRETVADGHHVPKRRADQTVDADLPDDLRAVLDACDGVRTVEEVGRVCRLLEFEITERIHRLAKKRLITMAPPQEAESLEEAILKIADAEDRVVPPPRPRRARRARMQLAG